MNAPEDWIGRSETRHDVATAAPIAGLAALLDHPPEQQERVPPLGHWLYFQPTTRQSGLGGDGHPGHGTFLPPGLPPRRMWAGGRVLFHGAISIGADITRRSIIAAIATKEGRQGRLVLVTLRHEVSLGTTGEIAIVEEQDLVFRDAPAAGAGPAEPPQPVPPGDSIRTLHPDPVLLFRYSALTFNAHRIHYDRDYARTIEGYPDLVVQGPLLATLLVDHHRRSGGGDLQSFSFRARAPLFAGADLTLNGRATAAGTELWASDAAGRPAMTASAVLR